MSKKVVRTISLPKNCVACAKELNGLNKTLYVHQRRRVFGKQHYHVDKKAVQVQFSLCSGCSARVKRIARRRLRWLGAIGLICLAGLVYIFLGSPSLMVGLAIAGAESFALNVVAALGLINFILLRHPGHYYFTAQLAELPFVFAAKKHEPSQLILKFSQPKALLFFKAYYAQAKNKRDEVFVLTPLAPVERI